MTPSLERRGAWSTWSAWRARLLRSALVWLALALLVWLDRHALAGAQRAEMFGWLVQAFQWIYDAFTASAAWLAANLVAVVGWLWDALKWLTAHVADFLESTGGMFARVWESAKTFYENVLRPALVWLYDFYTKVKDWLVKVFKPVFQFLLDVRDAVKAIYKRFVEPILTIIDATRAGLRLLGDLGVKWAQQLDTKLAELESIITRNFLLVVGKLNEVIDLVGSLVTPGGLLQRLPFLRTLNRDLFYAQRMFTNVRMTVLTHKQLKHRAQAAVVQPTSELIGEIAAYAAGESSAAGDAIDAAVAAAVADAHATFA